MIFVKLGFSFVGNAGGTQEAGERGEGSAMFSVPSPVRRKAKQKRQSVPAVQAYSIRNSEEFLISDAFDIVFGKTMSLLALSAVSAKLF